MAWLRTAAINGVIVAATVAAVEIGARVYDWSPRSVFSAADDGLGMTRYRHSPAGYGDLVPNQDGHWLVWHHRPYHVQTNSVGLRNVEEPESGAFRILVLGASQTFGPYVANDDTWPAWTENRLRDEPGTPRLQVFNAAIAGYTVLDQLALVRDKGLAFKPHLVILAVSEGINSLSREKNGVAGRPAARPPQSTLSRWVDRIKANSATVRLADQIKAQAQLIAANVDTRRGEGAVVARPPVAANQADLRARYVALFTQLSDMLRAHGIALATLFIPPPDTLGGEGPSPAEMGELIAGIARQQNVPHFDLTPIMRAERDPVMRLFLLQREPRSDKLIGNGHLSREGHAVVGRAAAAWLMTSGLIKP